MSGGGIVHYRARTPVLLIDQMVAWEHWRAGWCIADIGQKIARLPSETRAILHGGRA